MIPHRVSLVLLTVLLSFAGPRAARASTSCSLPVSPAALRQGSWLSPLTRAISFHGREVSLREALDRIAASARLRLSYSSETLPLDRRVCIAFDSVPAGDALTELLAGTPVRLVVIGPDHVVLAPALPEAAAPEHPPIQLDRIVVTGSADGAAERALPIALDVLSGRELARRSAVSLSQTMNGAVPGLWVWEQSPISVVAQYGSIRGASSFGSSYPKVYLDGIQLANPLLLTRITPNAIERIEVIRGPQGAALYGADAISGVANIISRHEVSDGGPHARMEAGFGLAGSAYASNPAVQQDYALALQTGSNVRSASLNVSAGGIGAYFPSIYSRQLSATAVARVVGSKSLLTGTFRLFGMRAGTAQSPILTSLLGAPSGTGTPSFTPGVESLGEYTAGVSAKFFPNDRWQHTITAGIDGYVLDGVPDEQSPVPSAEAAALNDARGAAARLTLRASSVLKLGLGQHGGADLTFSAEQSGLRERGAVDQLVPKGGYGPGGGTTSTVEVVRWRGNTGVTAQLNTALFDQLFLTGGVRLERDEGASGTGRFATLPMLGVAWTRGHGPLTFKLRAAYGKGIRWPEIPARETLWEGMRPGATNTGLAPEEQSGIEGGLDIYVARVLTFQVTRFDQTASGLIQRVSIVGDSGSGPGPGGPHLDFQLQNVGQISNRGWELQATARRGPLALAGAFTQVESRVRRTAAGYTGDLRPGDRMLEVPARTLSVTASWVASRWQTSLTAYRAMSWINYDRVAVAQAFAGNQHPSYDFVGAGLRGYWKEYPGVTHLRGAVTFNFRRRFGLTLSGDNLLNQQTGEPDNVTVLPGRTLSFGLRTVF